LRDKTSLLVFPQYAENPFTALLYSAVNKEEIDVIYVDHLDDFLGASKQLKPQDVIHVQWTQAVSQYSTGFIRATLNAKKFKQALKNASRKGVAIVWTIHNAQPHELTYPSIEVDIYQFLAKISSKIHILNESTPELLPVAIKLPTEKVHYITHPNYISAYSNTITMEEARKELGNGVDKKVILFIGNIRPYKGIEKLIDAFEILNEQDQNLVLILAGRVHPVMGDLLSEIRSHRNIVVVDSFIPDIEIETFMNSADVCVFPYGDILNSGSIVLSGSFKKPVVTSALPALMNEYGKEKWITFCDSNDTQALAEAIRASLDNPILDADFDNFLQSTDALKTSERFVNLLESARIIR
jgi:glycosyltransferase involved in cell wall biosynthesis